jgi:DNA-binding beta-propeller fold protein YncE
MRSLVKLCLIALALGATAFATVSGPAGLAVDGSGNLYVANFNANVVQVYNRSHKVIRTFGSEITQPYGVAADAAGNTCVTSLADASLNCYDPAGMKRIAFGLLGDPTYVAIDELGNVWIVDNSLTGIRVFDKLGSGLMSITGAFIGVNNFYGIAEHQGWIGFATDSSYNVFALATADVLLQTGSYNGGASSINGLPIAIAIDSASNVWVVADDGSVYTSSDFRTYSLVVKLSYEPLAIAVDAAHSLMYFSNNPGNSVDVYTTAGKRVASIK